MSAYAHRILFGIILFFDLYAFSPRLQAQDRSQQFADRWQVDSSAGNLLALHDLLAKWGSYNLSVQERLSYLDRAMRLGREWNNENDTILGDLRAWKALLHGSEFQIELAIEWHRRALRHYRRAYPDSNYLVHATYFHLAEQSFLANEFNRSQLYCDSALRYQWPHTKTRNWPRSTMMQARLAASRGDRGRAEIYSALTWPYQKQFYQQGHFYLSRCQAILYLGLQLPEKALEVLTPYQEYAHRSQVLAHNIGQAHAGMKNYEQALEFHQDVIDLTNQAGEEVHYWMEANVASTLSHLGRTDEALAFYRSTDYQDFEESSAFRHISSLSSTLRDAGMADSSVYLDLLLWPRADRIEMSDPLLATRYYANAAHHLRECSDPVLQRQPVDSFLVSAYQRLHALRTQIHSAQGRQNFARIYRRFFDHAIAIRYRMQLLDNSVDQTSSILQYMESTKSQMLRDEALDRFQGRASRLRFRQKFQDLQNQLESAANIQDSLAISDSLFFWMQLEDSLQLEERSIPIPEISAQYATPGQNEVYLEYFQHADKRLTLVIQSSDTSWCEQIDSSWYGLARSLHDLLGTHQSSLDQLDSLRSHLGELIIPAKIRASMSSHWVIIPDGRLSLIPFEVLVVDDRALIQSHVIAYAFSLAHLAATKAFASNRTGASILAPIFDQEERIMGRDFAALEYNLIEAQEIARIIPGDHLFTGTKADRKTFQQWAPRSALVHLATHALANTSAYDGGIVLAPGEEDRLLHHDELYALNIPAQLVVLSGCETGSGAFESGEGVMSFGRAFGAAGAQSILASLWSANDRSSAEIMISFYQQLRQSKAKDEALTLAKRQYLAGAERRRQHPYYWAGFVAMGNMSPVDLRNPIRWWIYVLPGLALFYLIWRRWRFSQRDQRELPATHSR